MFPAAVVNTAVGEAVLETEISSTLFSCNEDSLLSSSKLLILIDATFSTEAIRHLAVTHNYK